MASHLLNWAFIRGIYLTFTSASPQNSQAEEMQPEHEEGDTPLISDMDEAVIGDKDEGDEEEEENALNDSIMTSATAADLTSLPRKTKEGYVCPVCQKVYKQKQTLKVHVDGQHRGITLDCKRCDKKFKNPSTLYAHVKRTHGTAAKNDKESAEEATEQQGKCH